LCEEELGGLGIQAVNVTADAVLSIVVVGVLGEEVVFAEQSQIPPLVTASIEMVDQCSGCHCRARLAFGAFCRLVAVGEGFLLHAQVLVERVLSRGRPGREVICQRNTV
jgi:hypothetical protein